MSKRTPQKHFGGGESNAVSCGRPSSLPYLSKLSGAEVSGRLKLVEARHYSKLARMSQQGKDAL